MSDSTIKDVSDTAFMVAAYRALESERPNALFRDTLAADLLNVASIQYWIADYFSPASYQYRRRSGMSKALK
jgi:O-methyltransferase involved in polyketide biosynthesis